MVQISIPLGRVPMDWAVVAAISASFFLWINSKQASGPVCLLWTNGAAAGVTDPYRNARWADKPILLLCVCEIPSHNSSLLHYKADTPSLQHPGAAHCLMWAGDVWQALEAISRGILWPWATKQPLKYEHQYHWVNKKLNQLDKFSCMTRTL